MNLARIRQRVAGGGFKPFALRTSDGKEYPVKHPEVILVGRSSLAVLDEDQEVAFIDPLHVVALKNLSGKKNGSKQHSGPGN